MLKVAWYNSVLTIDALQVIEYRKRLFNIYAVIFQKYDPSIPASNLKNYSIGIQQDAMWFGVDTNANSNTGFIWYSANTKVMELGRNALLTVNNSIVVKNLKGPYANDSVATSNGVGLKEFYYDASGVVRIRLS